MRDFVYRSPPQFDCIGFALMPISFLGCSASPTFGSIGSYAGYEFRLPGGSSASSMYAAFVFDAVT